ncbi:MAG: hypothetical protein M3N53_01485 [Actinomycetota bacterium]|nr:hypothetical protein [Actinomycetota bacterium]
MRLLLGLWLFALGTVMFLRASLGLSPWDVLADGVRRNSPVTFGQAVILIGLVLVLGSLVAGIKPGPGTIANMILIGAFADLMLATGIGAGLDDMSVWIRFIVMLGGIVVTGIGSALYIGAGLGAGPRDSLMIAVATRAGIRVGIARAIIEGTALLLGFLLGGSIGVGTAVFALGIGLSVDVAFQLFGMDASGRKVQPA